MRTWHRRNQMKVTYRHFPKSRMLSISPGPWEVFQDTDGRAIAIVFELFTVSEKAAPVEITGGLRICA